MSFAPMARQAVQALHCALPACTVCACTGTLVRRRAV